MNANRPPNPFLAQQRKSMLPNIVRENKPAADDNLMRFYPLESTANRGSNSHGRAMPVNPLQHAPRQPAQPRSPAHTQPSFSMPTPMIPRNNQTQTVPPPNAQPHPPDLAAQEFRRVNRGLPDGVRYEPLDEDTMRLLRENGHISDALPAPKQATMPITAQNPVPAPTTAQAPSSEMQKSIEIIQSLIQDERNAHIFYSHLATSANIEWTTKALEQIAEDCNRNTRQLSELLSAHMNSSFTPEEAEINTGLELETALNLALSEESKTLRTLIELADNINIREAEKIIQVMINFKIANYNQLLRLI